ncbi:MAG: 3-phosphoshikimate 1-carboxyvinyltransferase [Firmicutes bacterium]|nr:3-phosphoshikimate 1-carboxyvinyltransferase [Bacillota bacterium]
MFTLDVFVGPSHLIGKVTPPPSKSVAHRALILTALAEGLPGMAQVKGFDVAISNDLQATVDCLGVLLGTGDVVELQCGESGSTLRFLIPVAAALGKTTVFRGEGRLAERPLREYAEILVQGGVQLRFSGRLNLPVTVSGQLRSGEFHVPGHISSQYITGLLLALPLLAGDSSILLTTPLESAPYVQLTEDILAQFGVNVKTLRDAAGNHLGWSVPGNQRYRVPAGGIMVEPDFSQAAFWLVAAFLGHSIEVEGLDPESRQGDRAILSVLRQLDQVSSEVQLTIDAKHIPDLVPILAVAACQRAGRTVVQNAGRLRYKESDRLSTTTQVLKGIGAKIMETEDSLIIEGGQKLSGGQANSFNDHRIAMSLAIAALNSERGVRIHGAEAVNKSYPQFFQELKRLGGDVRGI